MEGNGDKNRPKKDPRLISKNTREDFERKKELRRKRLIKRLKGWMLMWKGLLWKRKGMLMKSLGIIWRLLVVSLGLVRMFPRNRRLEGLLEERKWMGG